MASGGTVVRMVLIDEAGDEVGTAEVPIVVESPELLAAINELCELIREQLFLEKLKG